MSDLSLEGFGFWLSDPDDGAGFVVGFLIEGVINLMRQKHKVKARVRSVMRDRIGCEFEASSPEIDHAISHALSPVRLGQEMKAMPTGTMGDDEHALVSWPDGNRVISLSVAGRRFKNFSSLYFSMTLFSGIEIRA